MDRKLKFRLCFDNGIPTATLQQKRATIKNGHIMMFEPPNVKSAISIFHYKLHKYKPETPFVGPVQVSITWTFGTKSKAKIGFFRTSRPDIDNMAKILIDRMTKLGFWKDDSQISVLYLEKIWGEHSTIDISIMELE